MPTMTMMRSETGEDPACRVSRTPGPTSEQRAVLCSGGCCGGCQASKGEDWRGAGLTESHPRNKTWEMP